MVPPSSPTKFTACATHAADCDRLRWIDPDHGHVAGAAGSGARRHFGGTLGAERMANHDDAVVRMGAGIGGEVAALLKTAIGDDIAALAQRLGDDRQAVADKQAVHHIGAGGRRGAGGQRREQGHAAKQQTHADKFGG